MQQAIIVKSISISYMEQNPSGLQTIFFIHGNGGSTRNWNKQFASPMLAGYRLVAFDLPAHGSSGAPGDPTQYNLPFIAELMAAAVNELVQNDQYVVVGFSLGTNILAEMMAYDVNPAGIVLIGPCIVNEHYPFNSIGMEGFNSAVLFTDEMPGQEISKFFKSASISNDEADYEDLLSDYTKVQAPFRSMLLQTVMEGKINDEINLLVDNVGLPPLIIYGRDEKIINPYYLVGSPLPIWNNHIYKIPGASHFAHIDQPGAINKLIAEYCRSCFV